MTTNNGEDELTRASSEPNVKALTEEFRRCSPWNGDGFNRMGMAEDIRLCQWPGMSHDGKKHKELQGNEDGDVFPWDKASDARPFTVDDIIDDVVGLERAAFFRSLPQAEPVEPNDLDASGYANTLLNWLLKTKQRRELAAHVERHSQYTHTYGWSCLYTTWREEHQLRRETRTIQELLQTLGPQLGPQNAQLLPALLADPSAEQPLLALLAPMFPSVKPAKLRKAIRDLRTQGKAEVVLPYLCHNEPSIVTLRPWSEVFIPDNLTDIQRGPVFVRKFITEVELNEKVYTEGWDADWAAAAIKMKGRQGGWGEQLIGTGRMMNRGGLNVTSYSVADLRHNLIEVVYAYLPQLDEDGVPGNYVTIFSPVLGVPPKRRGGAAPAAAALHEQLDYQHGKLPFSVRKREELSERITDSRGVPELAHSAQRGMKVQEDAVTDLTSLAVVPPVLDYELDGTPYDFAPARNVPVTPGREPKFMNIPTQGGSLAFAMIERLQARVDRRFGRRRPDQDPQAADIKGQNYVRSNLDSWTEAFQQELSLCLQYLKPEEIARITGGALPADLANITEEADLLVECDVRGFSADFVKAQMTMMKELVVPLDRSGIFNMAAVASDMARAISPQLAGRWIQKPQEAQQAMVDEVRKALSLISNGFEPDYVQMDPAAAQKLKLVNAYWQQNPEFQQKVTQDQTGVIKGLFENYMKNLQQSVVQQQNEQTGRDGVKPMQPVTGPAGVGAGA